MTNNKVIKINDQWHSILGKEISLIEPYHYVKLSKILTPPKLSVQERNRGVATVLPYIRQKVKMWGADVLRAENIKTLIEEEEEEEDEEEGDNDDEDYEAKEQKKNQLSRFDCIASLLVIAECTVAQDIFRTLSQFPIAFPLIMPELDEAKKYKVMLPLYTGPVIKWETNPGTIIENHLFNDPFKLIVAVRIGTNTRGKSTILNQLMSSNSMFSSCSEPRAEYGIPHMASGSVEFTWLTQETCKVDLWNDVFENYYKEGAKEVMLLANLHGDALDYPDQVKFLSQFPSSFLVFLMPDCTKDQIDKFKDLISYKKVVYGCVNHKKFTNKKKYTIDTNSLTQDKTLKKVRMMLKEASNIDTYSFDVNELELGRSLRWTEGVELSASQNLIDFVKSRTCRRVKLEVLQLQRKQKNDYIQVWQNNRELREFISWYTNILKLPLGERRRALVHLEREISRLSMTESFGARQQAILKKEKLRKSSLINRNQEDEKMIREEIAKIWAEVDNMSLGLEHFFRELGQIYKILSVNDPNNEIVREMPKHYAELLISGHTIELLDGDARAISEAWFSAICRHICELRPKLRIFVISILGLQSSGKSTLLNALFACRFAVSVGRCTRGLFMRLLFLEKDLSDILEIDALVLIDTEGLGAPEKMNDPDSEKKDRILATFAMGISNLTILNVLGESMRDLTEILQIAIVTMARLEKTGMAPDIIMVQHVTERNTAKLSEPEENFRTALKEALKIAEEQDIEMGILNTECLQILDEGIRKGQLLKQFRPFKDGATAYAPPSKQYHEDVVNLYNSIIDYCKDSRSKIEFSEWHSLIQNYWDAVSHEDFAIRFKNIKEIYEFIDLGKRITKLKNSIDRAFLKHEEMIVQKVRSKIQNWTPESKTIDNDNDNDNKSKTIEPIRDECLELIKKELRDIPDCSNQINSNCEECEKTDGERIELEKYLKNRKNEKRETETKQTIRNYIEHNHQSALKKLTQMLDANIIRKGISSEFLELINGHLVKIIESMQNRNFSDDERTPVSELTDEEFSDDERTSVLELIDKEVECEYGNCLPEELYSQYKNEISPDLSECRAYKGVKFPAIVNKFIPVSFNPNTLNVDELAVLENNINNLIYYEILPKEGAFYPGIIRDLREGITRICTNYSYLPEFKWNVHLYSLLKFKPKMKILQEKRDKENIARKQEVEKIWDLSRDHISSKEGVTPVLELIDKEVESEYWNCLPTELCYQYKYGIFPDLSECRAYKGKILTAVNKLIPTNAVVKYFPVILNTNDLVALQNKIDNLLDEILSEERAFYPGIIREFKGRISQICDNKYMPEFKWNVHLYTLLKFKPKMKSLQEEWDKENIALGMLDQKKDEYLTIIDTRLRYGYSLAYEGHIVGDYLLRVIHKKAMEAGNRERREAVRSIAWMTCAESIRLKYFEGLAVQVQKGNKEEAIQHFLDPKQSIENWFKHTVDSDNIGNPSQKYSDTFNSEFERVLQEIRNCQSFDSIKKFVNDYMTQVDKVDYKLEFNNEITKEDLKILCRNIEEELNAKGDGRYPKQEPFQNPSDNKTIMEMLGCTELCYWCGALCWGSRDHHENSDITKVHHSSHQPAGLYGLSYNTDELHAIPCHKITDGSNVWYRGKKNPTKWRNAKARDFPNWKFEPHYIHYFNDLMCWFFEKLHKDIARTIDLQPATYNDLSKYGCVNLDYDSIISKLRTKI